MEREAGGREGVEGGQSLSPPPHSPTHTRPVAWVNPWPVLLTQSIFAHFGLFLVCFFYDLVWVFLFWS